MTREELIKKQAEIYTDDASNYTEWTDDGGWTDSDDKEFVEKAISLIDKYSVNPKHYFLYTIITKDMNESYERISHFRRNKRIRVQAQPYRDLDNSKQVLPQWQKDMARWANRKEIFKTVDFKDYVPRKGFICNKYFN